MLHDTVFVLAIYRLRHVFCDLSRARGQAPGPIQVLLVPVVVVAALAQRAAPAQAALARELADAEALLAGGGAPVLGGGACEDLLQAERIVGPIRLIHLRTLPLLLTLRAAYCVELLRESRGSLVPAERWLS